MPACCTLIKNWITAAQLTTLSQICRRIADAPPRHHQRKPVVLRSSLVSKGYSLLSSEKDPAKERARAFVWMASNITNNARSDVEPNRFQCNLPPNAKPWELGRKAKWTDLERFLDSSGADDFFVEDEALERTLTELQTIFNASRDDPNEWGLVHGFVANFGGDNGVLLKRVLALGIEPDLEENDQWRSSHLCGCWGRPESAKAIALCRPSLTAEDGNGATPRAAAATTYTNNEEMEKSGFPSVARMASKRQWWAVKNLFRRRLISDGEALEKCDGKTALEWALAFGETRLAKELRYFLRHILPVEKRDDFDGLPAKVVQLEASVGHLREDVQKVSDSTAKAVADAVDARAAEQRDAMTEYLSQSRIELSELRDEMRKEKEKVTDELKVVGAEIQKIYERLPTSTRSKRDGDDDTSCQVRRKNGGKVADGDGRTAAASAAHPLAAYFAKRVEAAARIPQQSPEFFAGLAELLDKYETVDQ